MTQSKLQETINQHGGNIKPIMDQVKQSAARVMELQDKRDEVNAQIAEERAKVKAIGISKKAFDFALKRKQMDEDERDKLDENYSVACEALGVPLRGEQGSLFDETPTAEGEETNATEEKSVGEQQAEAVLKAGKGKSGNGKAAAA